VRKMIIGMFISGAVFCRQVQAMEAWAYNERQIYEQEMQAVNECHLEEEEDKYEAAPGTRSSSPLLTNNGGDAVDQLMNGAIYALTKAGPVLHGMHESNALDVQSIARFYNVSTSTLRYRGLYGAEFLVGTAHNANSSLAPAAQLIYSVAKNVPLVGHLLERLKPNANNNNNNNRDGSSCASVPRSITPVSDAAFTLRHLNLIKVVIDIMQKYESEVNDFLKFMHKTTTEHGDTAISFLQKNKETISDTLRTTVQYAKDNKQEIIDGLQTVRDAYNEHGETVTAYLKEHSEEIKQQAEQVKTHIFPVFMAGMRAAYKEHVRVKNQQALLAAQKKHDDLLLRVSPDALVRREQEGRTEGMLDWIK
jgi:hypothetical protein